MKASAAWSAAVLGLGLIVVPTVTSAAPPPTIPPGFNFVTDDTGSIQVLVPDAWTDRDLAPAVAEDGSPIPYIEASTDRALYQSSFDAPGFTFWASAFNANPQELIDKYGLTSGCTNLTVEPYTDSVFTGLVQVGTGCGPNQGTWNLVAASPADQSATMVVQVQTSSPADQQAFDLVLASFDRVQGTQPGPVGSVPVVSVPVGSVPAIPTIPTVPTPGPVGSLPQVPGVISGPGTNPTGYAGNAVLLTMESGDGSIEVPDTWSTVTFETNASTGGGVLTATVDPAGFLTDGLPGLAAPGVRVITNPPSTVDTESTVTFLSGAFDVECQKDGPSPVDLNGFSGHMIVLAACSGTPTGRVVIVGATPTGNQIALVIQLTDIEDLALDLVLETATRNG